MLKSWGWGGVVGWVVAHVIIVSAQSKELGFWFLVFLDLEPIGTGDWGLGLGLDKKPNV